MVLNIFQKPSLHVFSTCEGGLICDEYYEYFDKLIPILSYMDPDSDNWRKIKVTIYYYEQNGEKGTLKYVEDEHDSFIHPSYSTYIIDKKRIS